MSARFFCACLEAVWKFEQRISYVGSLRVKLILVLNEQNLVLLQSYPSTTSEHAPEVERNY